jgi:uncharacterized membrane protein
VLFLGGVSGHGTWIMPVPSDFDLTLKRNCSISPHGLLWLFAVLACLSLGIGVAFAAAGAWVVLPFAGMEALALAAAFLLHGRHAGDYERIRASGPRLVVEVRDGETTRWCEFERQQVRVDERNDSRDYRLVLAVRGAEVEIGRHMHAERRRRLAVALRRALRSDAEAIQVLARF